MKENAKRIVNGCIFGFIILYLIYLLKEGTIIVNLSYMTINLVIYGILLLIFAYFLFFFAINPIYFKRIKLINILLSLFIIVISYKFLANSGIEKIYYGDIFILIGVILTILSLTNLFVFKDKIYKDLDVIEA